MLIGFLLISAPQFATIFFSISLHSSWFSITEALAPFSPDWLSANTSCSSAKIYNDWRAKFSKNVGQHGDSPEKILGFQCPRTGGSVGFEYCSFFSGIFLNMFRVCLVRQNNFCAPFCFYKVFFHINFRKLGKILFKMKPSRRCKNF